MWQITEVQASRFLELLTQLPIEIEDVLPDVAGIVAAGHRHEFTAYDALKVLAERLVASLASLDQQRPGPPNASAFASSRRSRFRERQPRPLALCRRL